MKHLYKVKIQNLQSKEFFKKLRFNSHFHHFENILCTTIHKYYQKKGSKEDSIHTAKITAIKIALKEIPKEETKDG